MYISTAWYRETQSQPGTMGRQAFLPGNAGSPSKICYTQRDRLDANEVIIITDGFPVNKKRQAVEKAVRTALTKPYHPR